MDEAHSKYKTACNKSANTIKKSKKDHWEDFLEWIDEKTIWTAHKYASVEASDSRSTRVPVLTTKLWDNTTWTASTNDEKPRSYSTPSSQHQTKNKPWPAMNPHIQTYGCRPGWTTTDALHYVIAAAKDAWRRGNKMAILFLDIKGAFPSVIMEHLMRSRGCWVVEDWL